VSLEEDTEAVSIKPPSRLATYSAEKKDLSSKKQKSLLIINTAPKMGNKDWNLILDAKKKISQSNKEGFKLY
jgi:acyl CoA:acetate/3-ketoacid CoA transferase beta subunit